VTWSMAVVDLEDHHHVMVRAEIEGVECLICGRAARATVGLAFAVCDSCARTFLAFDHSPSMLRDDRD
jgi:transposase-like protein